MTPPTSTVGRRKTTVRHVREKKQRGERLVCIAAYDAPMAQIADAIGFDMLINGNAGPMSLLGHKTPMSVRFEEQLALTQAVSRVTTYGMIVAHLPYMTYHASTADAVATAARLVVEGGADAVKCEGNRHTACVVREIVQAGIPAMGHIGLQASRKLEQSGYGFKGRQADEAARIVDDAYAFYEAGVLGFILEYVPVEITHYLAQSLPIPVISVGAGPSPDGIYLGSGDAVGYSAFPRPKNEPCFVNVRPLIAEALARYKSEALAGQYPGPGLTVRMDPAEHAQFLRLVA